MSHYWITIEIFRIYILICLLCPNIFGYQKAPTKVGQILRGWEVFFSELDGREFMS